MGDSMVIRIGTTGADTLNGTTGSDSLYGDDGNDKLTGSDGSDFLDGGRGDDTIYGGAGNDLIIDGPETDHLYGGDGIDTFQRDWTNLPADAFVLDLNFITGSQGAVGFPDDPGNDRFSGIENYTCFGLISGIFTGDDIANVIRSDLGTDTLIGNGGDDQLFAGGANDTLNGGKGADALHGEAGRDVMTGGAGNDGFYFDSRGQGVDRITDFSAVARNNDTLYFNATAFGMTAQVLTRAQFVTRADNLAHDPDDRFIYDTADHSLWFDSNGNANNGLTEIAVFQADAVVTWQDIVFF